MKLTSTIFLIMVFLVTAFAYSEMQYKTDDNRIEIQFNNKKRVNESVQTTLALPYSDAEIIINRCATSEYNNEGKLIGKNSINTQGHVQILNSFTLRELHAYHLNIRIENKKKNGYTRLDKIDFTLQGKDKKIEHDKISSAFIPIYRSMVDNYKSSYLRNREVSEARMLIICNEILQPYLDDFTEWKEARGITCDVATLSETGTTSSEIKDYIQNIFDTDDNPPSYLLIIGDVDDSYAVPSFYYGQASNVSDHPYSLLQGGDYFPDLLVGRFSIDSPMELLTIISKVLKYEKTPYLDDPTWLERALLVAGNYSTTPPIPSTPVKVSRWLRDKMLDSDYTQADTVFYPPTYPGTSDISSYINNGVGFVNYRGWGDANGWHYPYFHRENIEDLNNGLQLPVITSYVCNTGDFANDVDPCFGEKWLRQGMPASPKGGVTFVGPSDLHTSTKYNNSLFSGFYYGLLDEGIYNFGSAVLRGKYEMYENFPLIHEPGDDVEFYFYVYNILGDPSLQMWTKIPQQIQCDLPQEILPGEDLLEIDCSNLDNGVVTAVKDTEFASSSIIENGNASLNIAPTTAGEMVVTITGPNFVPFQDTVEVVTGSVSIGLENVNAAGELNAGEQIGLNISLQNYGSQVSDNTSATLSSNSQFVEITSAFADFGNILPGEVIERSYQISISPQCPNEAILEFSLNISDGTSAKFYLNANSLQFEITQVQVNGGTENLQKGEDNTVTTQFLNAGSFNAMGVTAYLSALSDAAVVTDSVASVGDVMVDETGEAQFEVFVPADCYSGREVPLEIKILDSDERQTVLKFYLEVGVVDSTAPTGPDKFGYYAYDSNDLQYDEAPDYQWYEIDPDNGGSGSVIKMPDDRSSSIALPFDFKYYDTVYDSITICTNGWLSFQTTWMTNFRNWNIPSALGPYAQVSPYWDDLIGEKYVQNDTIYHKDMRICYDYLESEDIFVIEWNECYNRFDDISPEKFEVILYNEQTYPTDDNTGMIQFNYHTISNPDANNNYCTVGVENPMQSAGLLYSYASDYPASCTPLQNELAIKFTTTPPDNYYAVNEEINDLPNIKLLQNYPNPAHVSTHIEFNIPKNNMKKPALKIYNLQGELVSSMDYQQLTEKFSKGKVNYSVQWDCTNSEGNKLPGGIYFYQVKAGELEQVRKMILLP